MKESLWLISLPRQGDQRSDRRWFNRVTGSLLEIADRMNEGQNRTSTDNDEHGWKHEQHHRNSQLGAQLVCFFFQLGDTFSPQVDSDTAQRLAQRRSVLQALADHGADPTKSIRRSPEFLECVAAIWQYPEVIEET